MRNATKDKPRITGKTAKLQKLEEALGYQLPSGLYINEPGIEEWMARLTGGVIAKGIHSEPAKQETDEEIDVRLAKRFKAMNKLTRSCIAGEIKALVVSGEPGLGKSYDIEQALKEYDPRGRKYTIVKGFATGTGFYKQLWDHRHEGSILVMDDCDNIWRDEKALGLLKTATDTSDERIITYLSEGTLQSDKDKSVIPSTFPFDGTIIFITNLDLDAIATSNHPFAPHMAAIMSRGDYIDLTMRNRRDFLIRIRQVVKIGLLNDMEPKAAKEVIDYVEENYQALRELSLRMVKKIANHRRNDPKDWKETCAVTCYRANK
jgi:hypothetical protein